MILRTCSNSVRVGEGSAEDRIGPEAGAAEDNAEPIPVEMEEAAEQDARMEVGASGNADAPVRRAATASQT